MTPKPTGTAPRRRGRRPPGPPLAAIATTTSTVPKNHAQKAAAANRGNAIGSSAKLQRYNSYGDAQQQREHSKEDQSDPSE